MRRDVFQAIADPVRRDIMGLLMNEPLSVNTVADHFDISRPAISKHLRILSECGLIKIHPKGRERFCEIQPHSLIPAFMWIDDFRSLWEQRLDNFEAYLKTLDQKNNDE